MLKFSSSDSVNPQVAKEKQEVCENRKEDHRNKKEECDKFQSQLPGIQLSMSIHIASCTVPVSTPDFLDAEAFVDLEVADRHKCCDFRYI